MEGNTLENLLSSQRFWTAVVSAVGLFIFGTEYQDKMDVAAIVAAILALFGFVFAGAWKRPFAIGRGNFWSILNYKPFWASVGLIVVMVAGVLGFDLKVDPDVLAGGIVIIIGVLQGAITLNPPQDSVG